MKIKPEDYQYMLSKIRPLAPQIPELRKTIVNFNDVEKRLRWDLCYKAGLSYWIVNHLYPQGINDDHVDTALRHIMKELTDGTDTSTAC